MTEQTRIDLIEHFVHEQAYLKGVAFKIRIDDGIPIITLKSVQEGLLFRFRAALRNNDVLHIKVEAMEIIKDPPGQPAGGPSSNKKRRRRRR